MVVLGLIEWRNNMWKVMSRRNWTVGRHEQWELYVGQLVRVGRALGRGNEDVYGVVRLVEVHKQSLANMPLSDVVREGGGEGESVEHFILETKHNFVMRKVRVPKVGG
jgi:hypothetical protein